MAPGPPQEVEPSGGTADAAAVVAAAFEGTAALCLVLGADGRVAVANPAVTRATGWTKAELAARPFWQVHVAPEEAERARADFATAMSGGLDFATEGNWLDRCGGRRRVSMQLDILRNDRAGRARCLWGVWTFPSSAAGRRGCVTRRDRCPRPRDG